MRLIFLGISLGWLVGCATGNTGLTNSDDVVVEPMASGALAPLSSYEGHWEMAQCLDPAKQAHRYRIEVVGKTIRMSRWTRLSDTKPQFTGSFDGAKPFAVEYQDRDLITGNPVVSQLRWVWKDQRIQGQMRWLPGPGDPRGNWSAMAQGHLHVTRAEPGVLWWTRWGTTLSDQHGKQDWTSRCKYKKVKVMGGRPKGGVDFSRVELLQTLS